MPAKSVAASAGRKAVLGRANAALAALDDVIHLPMAIHVLGPAAAIELQAIAAKMAVTVSLVEDFSQRRLLHGAVPITITLAREVAEDQRRPIDPDLALRFLPLVAIQQTDEYDAWARRWLSRWLTESNGPRIDDAAEVAALLADLPSDADALDALARAVAR
jgi:hypothetical protein